MENEINKEIKRIKSLFTEERLYGNLIKEQENVKGFPKTATQFNPRRNPKYSFVTYNPDELKNVGGVYNYDGLVKIKDKKDWGNPDLIPGLEISEDDNINKAVKLWTSAMEGEYFNWSEEEYLKKGVELFDDLVSLSKAIYEFNIKRNFKEEIEDEYVDKPWFGKEDTSTLYESFVKPLLGLPYAITKDGEKLTTWKEYKQWVEAQIPAFKDWKEKKDREGTIEVDPYWKENQKNDKNDPNSDVPAWLKKK